MAKVYKGDINTRIELDAGVDISLASSLTIRYKKPDGVIGEWEATLSDTTKAYYDTQAEDLDVVGLWQVQLSVVMATWIGDGEKTEFTVYDPLELYESGEEQIQGNYITESDVDNWSDDEDKQDVIDRAEQLIESVTHDYFYEKAFSVYLDGNGKDGLFPGLVGNILTVTEILIRSVELPSTIWTYNKYSVYLDPETATAEDLAEIHLRLKSESAIFPKGRGNIKVTGTHGWTSTPAAIKKAAIILARYENDPTLYAACSTHESESIGDHSFRRGRFLTGVLEADRLIRSFIKKRTMPRAV